MVADGDRDRLARGRQPHDDVPALAVLDGVDDQVAQDPLDPAGVDLGDDGLLVAGDTDPGCPCARPAARPPRSTRRTTSRRSVGSASSTAAPASNRLISSRSASSASNRSSWVCRISALRATAGSKSLAGLVQDVGRHPHGRQRRAQLVRDVGDEPALHPGQLLQLADLPLQVCAIWLNDAASRARSSSPRTRIRSSSRPAESRSAIRAAIRTGVTTCRVTSQAMPPSSTTTNSPAVASVR